MKKRICLYIGCDVLIFCILYLYYFLSLEIKQYRLETLELSPLVFVMPFLIILIGAIFALLVWISSQYEFTTKQTVLEFILVGIPAFYFATFQEILYGMYFFINVSLPVYKPNLWLMTTQIPSAIGGVVFGYELFMLIRRQIKYNRKSIENVNL
ncbi:hypothetical protein [Clostridium aminobutyricum]|uniref:Uncharacterized protein n=1 Tax=Clostridium aminobutyricum TaxID=33953 RepID=A0A939D747_CLOAM|nr:hypothetical protein [Clostridium aminobutyricum]MBN7772306.1 hypothetical protein [Clostridium aminobutyricum]